MSIEIAVAGAERIDELEPLWLALHRHHRAVAAQPVVGDDAASWDRGGGRGISTCWPVAMTSC